MAKNKINLPTNYGEVECDITFSREAPQETFSLINMDVSIVPVKVDQSVPFRKDTFVNIFIDEDYNLQLEFRLSYIKTKMAQIIEDQDYYHLTIHEFVRVPRNREIALKVTINASLAKILFGEKPRHEEIIQRLRLEMASQQTTFNPNADGRFPKGTIYGWGGTT